MKLTIVLLVPFLNIALFSFHLSAKIRKPLEWWQYGVIYQIFPRSFKDSDGDGIGDLKGIEEKAAYLKELGVSAVWLSPIFESPMVDFGYDVSDFYDIAAVFGTLEDFRSLKRNLDSLNIKLILDFVPNHTSDRCQWFKNSEKRIEPYTDFYIWKDPAGWNGSDPIPPNNWVSVFHGSAWKYSDLRKQFYLHQFSAEQPDLNFRNENVLREIENILTYWLDQGVDGFRMDSVAYLLEHPDFPDEPKNDQFASSSAMFHHNSLLHIYSKDWIENYRLVQHFHNIVESYSEKDQKLRVVVNEAYTSFEKTVQFYDDSGGRNMPFNFLLITDVNFSSNAHDFARVIRQWMNGTPKNGWPNWVIGNHDNSRVASRFGCELSDGMNMINLLLPGTAFTYSGEEIGMVDGIVRWDQTLDPCARNSGPENFREFSRDPARTPFQWDASTSSGFTTNSKPWLPVNPNYWELNLQAQRKNFRSHYNIYRRLVQLRSHPAFQYGSLNIFTFGDWVLVFTRELEDYDTIVVVVNIGSEEETVTLSNQIKNVPDVLVAHTCSVNSEHEVGSVFRKGTPGFTMRPKSSLILTSESVPTFENEEQSLLFSVSNYLFEHVFNKIFKLIH